MVLDLADLPAWRDKQFAPVVAVNGCFDIIHVGHVRMLEAARKLGSVLVVGINSDSSIRLLKGDSRPIQHERDRAEILNALRCVDAVVIFDDIRATGFLDACWAHVHAKGATYDLGSINPEERAVLDKHATRIVFLPFTSGKSTSSLIESIRQTSG